MSNPIIKNYLEEIKEKLPEWLKDNKAERDDILDEIEEHIWEKASEISQSDDPSDYTIQQAIQSMGKPADIAKDYKKRGTPKFYITEELFPMFKKTLSISFSIIFVIAILTNIPWSGNYGFWQFLSNWWNSFIGMSGAALFIVTGLFVYLSMEGFLPEDLDEKNVKSRMKDIEIDAQTTIQAQCNIQTAKKKKKSFYTPGEWISGAIVSFIFGAILITQPFPQMVNFFENAMLGWIRIYGILVVVDGFLQLMHVLVQKSNVVGHQALYLLKIVQKILIVLMLVQLFQNPEMIQYTVIDDGVYELRYLVGDLISLKTFRTISIIIFVLSALDICEETYKMLSLQSKYAEEQKINPEM